MNLTQSRYDKTRKLVLQQGANDKEVTFNHSNPVYT